MAERDASGQPALPSLRALLLGTAAPLSDALSEWENDYRAAEADPLLSADQRIALWMDQDHTLTKRVHAVPVRSLADAVAAAGQYLKLAQGDATAHAVPEAVDLALAEGLHAYLSELRAAVQAAEHDSDPLAILARRYTEVTRLVDSVDARHEALRLRMVERNGEPPKGVPGELHWGHDHEYADFAALSTESDRLGDVLESIANEMFATEARSIEGMVGKVHAILQLLPGFSGDDIDSYIARTARDVLLDIKRFLSGMPLRLVQNSTQPDQPVAHLTEQWERYTTAAPSIAPDLWSTVREWAAERRRLDEAEQPGKGPADYTAYNRLCTELISTPANSFTGIALKVAVALGTGALHEFGDPERRAIAQAGKEAASLADPLECELAELLTEGVTEALGRQATPSEQPAAFHTTIAAFRGEASVPLAIPDTPTEAMVQAGAAVGGCSPETVRAAFAAMVEAYRREAA